MDKCIDLYTYEAMYQYCNLCTQSISGLAADNDLEQFEVSLKMAIEWT